MVETFPKKYNLEVITKKEKLSNGAGPTVAIGTIQRTKKLILVS